MLDHASKSLSGVTLLILLGIENSPTADFFSPDRCPSCHDGVTPTHSWSPPPGWLRLSRRVELFSKYLHAHARRYS